MKINKVSDEKTAPSWAFGSKSLDNYRDTEAFTKKEIERLNITKAASVTEVTLAKECEAIEKCATTSKTYHYNETWQPKDINHLKEYASACGLNANKVKGVDPAPILNDMNNIEKQASTSYMIKTASSNNPEKLKLALSDPFHIEEKVNSTHMDKYDWQQVTKQANLAEIPSMDLGAIKSIRGSESIYVNSEPKTAINQNSIVNPDAIKNLSESTVLDNGARLKQEKAAREEAKRVNAKEWEKNVISSMEKNDIVPKGSVFPTESMHAQNGLSNPSSSMGVYAKFDKNDIPEKTAGELIKERNISSKQSIQRAAKEKEEFKMEKAEIRTISTTFADELKKHLK